jgi:hypothetical protein
MVSSVRSRPNHYETLGLAPSASDEEIAEAFARKMGELRWHPVGSKAVICIAYETLRNAAKRRRYDLSLGLISKSAPRQWGFAVTPQRWAFIAAEPANPGIAPIPEPHVTAEPAEEPRVASFISSSLRDLARPMGGEASSRPTRTSPAADARVEREIEQILTAPVAEGEEDSTERRFGWAKPVLAVGGFVLAAGLVGTVAGLSVTDNQAPAQAEPAAAVGRPPAKQDVGREVASPAPVVAPDEAQVEQPFRAAPKHSLTRQRPSAWAQRQVRDIQSGDIAAGEGQATELASGELASDPLAPQSVAAKMALPDKVVARTLDRVGYKCGEVASTAAVEGSSGAFKVTCTSGQTYQATQVRGRYRFSRSGGQ